MIDPRAVVHEKAEIGENVAIGPFTIIEENVRIGAGTRIASNVLIASGTRIGKNCQIHHGAVLGTLPQYIGFDPAEVTTLEIGDETIIREYCTLNRGTEHRQKTVVGSHCYLMAYTHVGHDGIVGNHVILANAVNLGGHVVIEDYAGIGGIVPVHQFVRIGCHSFIGGGYRVTKDVPPYILASGDPLTFGGLNTVGLTRRGFSQETLRHLKRAYKIIYRSNLNVSQAITRIREELEETEEIKNIIDFIESSERGIIR
ncbi:MAG: acyl-ACP--UDP-N-acetylglucosamine O-acyltransferase [candidate division KSB1 bacterium]|nr:acyl-ACP--UDP-N-acetylglucosamine O-acyltransferase [candidate division KSB1 bacterium]